MAAEQLSGALVLKRTEQQQPRSIVSNEEVHRGIAEGANAVEDDDRLVHVENNGNKTASVFVISIVVGVLISL